LLEVEGIALGDGEHLAARFGRELPRGELREQLAGLGVAEWLEPKLDDALRVLEPRMGQELPIASVGRRATRCGDQQR
jgi:hypothetical protein